MRKVYIEGPRYGIDRMFSQEGWDVVSHFDEADLIQFTGGADVSPELYGEVPLDCVYTNPQRDEREISVFKLAVSKGKAMAGICRGGQLLNVLCGGRMWQDVNNHAIQGTHEAWDPRTGEVLQVTSTHHQQMIPTNEAIVCLLASQSTTKERWNTRSGGVLKIWNAKQSSDTEACFYPKENAFCFQPHPEYDGYVSLRKRYIKYVEELCFDTNKAHASTNWTGRKEN